MCVVNPFVASILSPIVWPVHIKEIEPRRHALEQLQVFSREKLSSSLTSSGGSCHFARLRNSLISLALGPPTSSVPGVATPSASVSPRVLDTHCHNVSVLPKKLAVRDCGDSAPRVTTFLSSYALRSKLSACLHSSCRPL